METFPLHWPFVRGIHRSPVNSPHKGQWRGGLMFFFYLCLKQQLSKQWRRRWFETPSCSLWRHCNSTDWEDMGGSGLIKQTSGSTWTPIMFYDDVVANSMAIEQYYHEKTSPPMTKNLNQRGADLPTSIESFVLMIIRQCAYTVHLKLEFQLSEYAGCWRPGSYIYFHGISI